MQDLHIHTTYSDGELTPDEWVREALKRDFTKIGFADHSYTSFDLDGCMVADCHGKYQQEIASLKEKYRGKIEILCGIEQDYYADEEALGFDYIIGSVHTLKKDGVYFPVDISAGILEKSRDTLFNGDIYSLVEYYYQTVADVVNKTHATIIGHFDLITMFQEEHPLFDENHPRYIKAWQAAADKLLKTDAVFEINTGAIAHGHRTTPYPSVEIRSYLKEKGATLILNSDSHSLKDWDAMIGYTGSTYKDELCLLL